MWPTISGKLKLETHLLSLCCCCELVVVLLYVVPGLRSPPFMASHKIKKGPNIYHIVYKERCAHIFLAFYCLLVVLLGLVGEQSAVGGILACARVCTAAAAADV